MRLSLLLLFSGFLIQSAQAQPGNSGQSGDSTPAGIRFHTPGVIDSLERAQRGRDELQGYRIQIFLGSATEAKSVRQKALSLQMGLPVQIVQNIPNYAVRVGDFRSALEAHKYLSQVRAHYPAAFVVTDQINPPRLPKRNGE